MSTDAAEPTVVKQVTWRLDTDNGSMEPRSALDVLVDLNEKVSTGNVGEYQPVPLGFTPLDKTIGTGLRAGELLLIGGAQGTGVAAGCEDDVRRIQGDTARECIRSRQRDD